MFTQGFAFSEVTGVEVTAPSMTVDEALAAGMPRWGLGHAWLNAVGRPARPEFARALGLPLTGLAEWAGRHLRPARPAAVCPTRSPGRPLRAPGRG